MTCGPIRRFVVTVAAAAAVSLLLIYLDAAAQTRPPSNGAAASVPTPRTPDGKPDLSGRWGGGCVRGGLLLWHECFRTQI